jgi:hypothetical protein
MLLGKPQKVSMELREADVEHGLHGPLLGALGDDVETPAMRKTGAGA